MLIDIPIMFIWFKMVHIQCFREKIYSFYTLVVANEQVGQQAGSLADSRNWPV